MAEESFPVVEQPMTAEQWKHVTRGIGDGILDEGGFPYRLTGFDNTTNTAVLRASTSTGVASAILGGFYHKMDSDITLSFPPVAARSTYYVMLQHDPLDAEMPVKVVVSTSVDTSQGKTHLHLYNVVRNANELLTDAAVRMIRPRIAPVQVYASDADLPQANKVLWGTLAIVHNGRYGNNSSLYIAMTGDDGESTTGWFWKKIYDPNDNVFVWSEIGDTGTYRWPEHGFRRALGRRGKVRKLRGRVALVSGNKFQAGGDYSILSGPIAPEDAPAAVQRFAVSTGGSGAGGQANVEVSSTGAVTAKITDSAYWVSLDGIEWEAK